MHSLRGRRGAILALAVVAALALAVTAAASTNRSGKSPHTFLWLTAVVPTTVDSAVYQGRPSSDVESLWAAPLLRWRVPTAGQKALNGPFAVTPFLSESYKRLANGSYEFKLREAKSEYGNVLTAADVKWSFDRQVAIDPIAKALFTVGNVDLVNPVNIVDDRTIVVHVTDASALTLGALAWYLTAVIDSTEVKKHTTAADPWAKTWLSSHSASFGPYKIDGFISGNTIAVSANPNYWGAKPWFTKVIIKAIPEAATRLQLMKNGQASHTSYLDYGLLANASTDPNLYVTGTTITSNTDLLALNTRIKPFDDARVRRAIAVAIDRDALIKSVYKGYGKPGVTPINSNVPWPVKLTPIKTDLAEARRLLAEAGLPNGFEFTAATSIAQPGNYVNDSAAVIQSQLAQVGIKMNIQIVIPVEMEPGQRAGKYQAVMGAFRPAIADAAYHMFAFLYSKGPITYRHGFSNAAFDKLTTLALHTDPGKRHDRYVAAGLQLAVTEMPYVPLVETIAQHVFAKDIKGWFNYPNEELYVDTYTVSK